MSNLFEIFFEFSRALSEKHFPSVSRFIRRLLDWKAFAFSWSANYSRKYGTQAVMAVGVLASLYAVFLFATRALTPEMPKPSHDVILKSRFSSPLPSEQIVIVDIDERTLALLSAQHGRWPWSRDVLADGVQKIADLQARTILFNVMLSDPDIKNADADAAMDVTAQLVRPIAFPIIRLAPENDAQSKLKVSQIPGANMQAPNAQDSTLAAVLPMFGTMHDRLGVVNQKPDADGIVRKYPLRWQESGYVMPSIVGRALEVGGESLEGLPSTLSLNWRNKRGKYTRISFGDLVQDKLSDGEKAQIKDAFIVLSASAPGIGQTKPTGVSPLEDDGEILATAIDDAVHKTYLRTMPDWLALIINLCIIWGLVWVTTHNSVSMVANRLFLILQAALGGLTLVSASYTHYLIDLSDSMSFGIGLFGIIKLLQSLDDRWSRAKPGFRKIGLNHGAEQLLVLGWLDDQLSYFEAQGLQRRIESVVGMPQVARVDDLFAGESFVKSICSSYKSLLVHVQSPLAGQVDALLAEPAYSCVMRKTHNLLADWDTENKHFVAEAAPLILEMGSELLHRSWLETTQAAWLHP